MADDVPPLQWLKRVDDPRSIIHRNTTIKVDGTYFVVLPVQHLWQRDDGSYMSELVIAKTVSQDSGMYVCLGANRRGYNYRSTFLTVLPRKYGQCWTVGRCANRSIENTLIAAWISNYIHQ